MSINFHQLGLMLRARSTVSSRARPALVEVCRERGHTPLFRCQCLLAIIFLPSCLVGNATAQVKFVKLMDPYPFDKTEGNVVLFDTPRPIATPSPSPSFIGESMTWQKRAYISTALQFFVAVLQFLVVVVSVYLIWQQLKKQEEELKNQGEQLEKQGKQLEQQTELARFANTQALVALSSPFNLEMAKNGEMAELWTIGPKEWETLDNGKKQQHESMLRWWFIFYENIFFQNERGLLDAAIFAAWKKDIDVFVEEQFVEKYWSHLSQKYHKEFVDYLNSRIKIKEEARKTSNDGSSSLSY